jgi:hypothetical protein
MKFPHLSIIPILCLILLFSCNSETAEIKSDEPAESNDRNMFGRGMPRGLILNSDKAEPGYIMYCVPNSALVYLINRKGEVVHQWKGNYGVQGAYLNNDGSVSVNSYDLDFPVFAGGGESGRIEKISWDSKILWDFEYANEEYHHHHDFAVIPNGNILAIAWESKSAEEVLAAGRKPDQIPKAGLWPDKIVEIKPTDKTHGEIVWEWHMWDHMIQNHDPKKRNYGNPSDHPELLDINIGEPLPEPISQDSMDRLHAMGRAWRNRTIDNFGSDIYHINAINYSPELDQIAISSPNLSEIFVIDHSTTSKEAAGHSGGKYGKGGDFLYRWGNAQNYGKGDSTDQKLYHQHDVRWVEPDKPGAGNLTIYNNDVHGRPDSMNYSAIYEIIPPMDSNGNYIRNQNEAFGPQDPSWVYTSPDTVSFWSSFISGAHRMKNGNTFINEGSKGRFFEVTPDGELVWEYWVPYRGEIRKPNGDPIPEMPFTFIQFRSTFIPTDHPAFAGRELAPIDPQPEEFVPSPPPSEE